MVPKLRFKEFCGEWEEKRLGNYVHLKNGLNVDKDKFGQGIPLISVMDILNNNFIVFNNIKGKVDIDSETLKNYSVTYGDILFQRSSETREDAGKSNVYLDKEKVSTFGGFVIRGKKIGIYNPVFMNSLLKTSNVRKEITSKAHGAQHINISQESLEKVNITLPSLPEQTKIADFLSTVDDKIQNQQDKVAHLENIKKGFMQKIFSRKIRFKDDGGEEFPEWEEKKLGDCLHYEQPSKYIVKSEKYNINYDTPVLTANKAFILGYTNEKDGVYDKGEVIIYDDFTMDMKFVDFKFKVKSSAIKLLTQKNTVLYFMYCYLKNLNLSQEEHRRSYISQIEPMKIKLPCLKEQQKIADFLSSFDQKISTEKEILEHLKQLKKGLLQQMFV